MTSAWKERSGWDDHAVDGRVSDGDIRYDDVRCDRLEILPSLETTSSETINNDYILSP